MPLEPGSVPRLIPDQVDHTLHGVVELRFAAFAHLVGKQPLLLVLILLMLE